MSVFLTMWHNVALYFDWKAPGARLTL